MSSSILRIAGGSLPQAWDRSCATSHVGLLEELVNVNSFGDNLAGVDEVRERLAAELVRLEFSVESVEPRPSDSPRRRARHLVARRRGKGSRAPRVLLIAHLDTVFPECDAFSRMERQGDTLSGPGVGDIKGGCVALLGAFELLRAGGALDACDLTFVANSDEEVGSHSSREILRELAQECDVALGFEPAFHPPGASVSSRGPIQHVIERKGCGRFAFTSTGVAAHAGGAHHLGVSAIEGLARKVIEVHALADSSRGITTNVGLIAGGRSCNTVAPSACGEIDFRYRTAEDGLATAHQLRTILERPEQVNPLVTTPVSTVVEPGSGALWPPLLPTPASRALSRLVVECTEQLGWQAEGIARGGASDAAHAAAAGLPAICGLGPVSSGIHTDKEQTSVSALRASACVAATFLDRLARQGLPQEVV